MRFLWWGLRLGDPEDRNAAPTDLATHQRVLSLHLEPLRQRHRLAENREAMAEVRRDAARSGVTKVIELIPGVGAALSLLVDGAGFTRRAAKLAAERSAIEQQQQSERVSRVARAGADDIVTRTLEEVEALFTADDEPMAGVPLVLFVDDAQFGRPGSEEGALHLVTRLWDAAVLHEWPLLLVASHWEREWWNADERATAPDFAGIFRPQVAGNGCGRLVVLGKEPALAALVRAGLPGLPEKDVGLILDRADGNPQLLMEIVDRVRRSPAWRLDEGPLSAVGHRHLSTARFELHDLIRQRMEGDETSDAVRRAIAVSSVQGVEFSCSLVEAAEGLLHAGQLRAGLEAAETRHGYVSGVDRGIAGFLQRAYRDAALALVDGQFGSVEEVGEALAVAADRLVDSADGWGALDPAEQDAVLALQASLGEDAPDPAVRLRAARAMVTSALRALMDDSERLDIPRSAFWAKRFAAGLSQGRWKAQDFETEDLSRLHEALHYWSGAGSALPLSRALADLRRERLPVEPKSLEVAGLVTTLWTLSDGLVLEGRFDEAHDVSAEALTWARALQERDPTVEAGAILTGGLEREADRARIEEREEDEERLLRERLALTRDLAVAHPTDGVTQANRTLAMLGLAWHLQRHGPSEEAVEWLLAAHDAEVRDARRAPSIDGTRRLAAAVLGLADADVRHGRPEAAAGKFAQVVDAVRELFAIEPRQEHRIALCEALERAGSAAWDRGDLPGAERYTREALDLLEAVSPPPDLTHAWRQVELYRAAARYAQVLHAGGVDGDLRRTDEGSPPGDDALPGLPADDEPVHTLRNLVTSARAVLGDSNGLCWGYAELAGRLGACLETAAERRGPEATEPTAEAVRKLFTQIRTEVDRRNAGPALANWYQGGLYAFETIADGAKARGLASECIRTRERALRWALDYVETIGGDEALGDLFFWVMISAHEILDLGGRLDPEILRACGRVALAPPAEDETADTSRYRSPALSLLATLGGDIPAGERAAFLESAGVWFRTHGSTVAMLVGYEAEIECGLLDHDPGERERTLDAIESDAFEGWDPETRGASLEWRLLGRLRRQWGCTGTEAGPEEGPGSDRA